MRQNLDGEVDRVALTPFIPAIVLNDHAQYVPDFGNLAEEARTELANEREITRLKALPHVARQLSDDSWIVVVMGRDIERGCELKSFMSSHILVHLLHLNVLLMVSVRRYVAIFCCALNVTQQFYFE